MNDLAISPREAISSPTPVSPYLRCRNISPTNPPHPILQTPSTIRYGPSSSGHCACTPNLLHHCAFAYSSHASCTHSGAATFIHLTAFDWINCPLQQETGHGVSVTILVGFNTSWLSTASLDGNLHPFEIECAVHAHACARIRSFSQLRRGNFRIRRTWGWGLGMDFPI